LASDVVVDQRLEILLLPALRLRLEVALEHVFRKIVQRALAGEDRPTFLAVPASVAVFEEGIVLAVGDDPLGDKQAAGALSP
jgi:hypothetical protein